jgi:hypothetical protein
MLAREVVWPGRCVRASGGSSCLRQSEGKRSAVTYLLLSEVQSIIKPLRNVHLKRIASEFQFDASALK